MGMFARHITPLLTFLVMAQSPLAQAQTDSTESYVPCSHRGHVECIRITGREVFQHGSEGRWSEHWWRMSYIGRACEERLGKPKGVFLETLFALPHYMAMGVMNVAGLTKYAFTRNNRLEGSKTADAPIVDTPVY